MDLELKLEEEAVVLMEQMEKIEDKTSERYKKLLNIYQAVTRRLDQETKRIESQKKLEHESRRLQIEQDKIDSAEQIERVRAQVEEEKLKEQKKSRWWGLLTEGVKAVLYVAGNIVIILFAIRANNSGETLTSFETKFIQPKKY